MKLQYNGVKTSGFVKGLGGVVKGQIYDVSDNLVKGLLSNGEWKQIIEKKEVVKKEVKKSKIRFKDDKINMEDD